MISVPTILLISEMYPERINLPGAAAGAAGCCVRLRADAMASAAALDIPVNGVGPTVVGVSLMFST